MQKVEDHIPPPVVIAVMGMTGTGKSTFIRLLTRDERIHIGHGPTSETSIIQTAKYVDQKTGRTVILIDTPGFDDSRGLTDTDILKMISRMLGSDSSSRPKLNGLIYMHRISDPRVGGTSRKNLRMFHSLCGDDTLSNVRIVTTNWGRVSEQEGAERTEALSREAFKLLLEAGAKILRHDNNLGSAENIMSQLIPLPPITTQLERELHAGKKLNETAAGSILAEEIAQMQESHAKDLADLKKEMQDALQANDRALRDELEQERRELQQKMEEIENDRRELDKQNLSNLPTELLIHITLYLTPPALLSLCCTNKRLHEFIKDDKIWFWAFLYYFVGIGPMNGHGVEKIQLLRREKRTWRKEFILRYKLLHRWEHCRNPVITYSPGNSTIDEMVLVSDRTLLTFSPSCGKIVRSLPLKGKTLPGAMSPPVGGDNYWDQFCSNISTTTILCQGDGVYAIWGKLDGSVTYGDSPWTDPTYFRACRLSCKCYYEHTASVRQIVLDRDTLSFVTAGADGRVKIWKTEGVICLWNSRRQRQGPNIDPFVAVAGSLRKRCIAGALTSGDILLWFINKPVNLNDPEDPEPTIEPTEFRVADPIHEERQQNPSELSERLQPAKIWLCRIRVSSSECQATVFVQYVDYPSIYRISVDAESDKVEATRFGDRSDVHISVVELSMASRQSTEASFIFIGDKLGFVSIYDAGAPFAPGPVGPIRRFEAHASGAVTAIAWDGIVMATGSSLGATIVWDALTLEPLRFFHAAPILPFGFLDIPETTTWPVINKIVLGTDIVVIAADGDVMAWRLERVSKSIQRAIDRQKNEEGNRQRETNADTTQAQKQDAVDAVSNDPVEGPHLPFDAEEITLRGASTPSQSFPGSSCQTHDSSEIQNRSATPPLSNEEDQIVSLPVSEPTEAGTINGSTYSTAMDPLASFEGATVPPSNRLGKPMPESSDQLRVASPTGSPQPPPSPSKTSSPTKFIPAGAVGSPDASLLVTDNARDEEALKKGFPDVKEVDDDLASTFKLSLVDLEAHGHDAV